ncbi:shikimate dehydrogenase [Williamsia sp. 1135]|uniref:shikimate dehydrogenase n=1 Tax=Williamsia sp. 1135 TaxID=1889262 RepID=UPI000A11D317|nr:shikimate dehydrogenase [Williamsia sp. 1135]ORM24049.1 shikimate dehydrogenase [Williamsia sp. 1135]
MSDTGIGVVTGPRAAAILGAPVSHSRSPALHLAAYEALGLTGWTYERMECTAEQLPALVAGLDERYVGLSVTMPGKRAALAFADHRTERAVAVGSANTLVRREDGWHADCTDVDGASAGLADLGITDGAGSRAVLVGAGGTAAPVVAALAAVGFRELSVVARSADRASEVLTVADAYGIAAEVLTFEPNSTLRERSRDCAVLVNTVPAAAAASLVPALSSAPRLFDVIYDPWPTPLAAAVESAGGMVVGGLVMLLNQAFGQVEQFTGMPAPRVAMAAALV